MTFQTKIDRRKHGNEYTEKMTTWACSQLETHQWGILVLELPHGVNLPTGVNLDYEEQVASQAFARANELWSLGECPEDLLKEGTDKGLAPVRDFGACKLVPLAETTQEEQRKALPTNFATAWKKTRCCAD